MALPLPRAGLLAIVALLSLSGCTLGRGGDEAAPPAPTPSPTATPTPRATAPPTEHATADVRDALEDFAACMRGQGVELPDLRQPEDVDPRRLLEPDYRRAAQACRSMLDGVLESLPLSPGDLRRRTDRLSACLREQGVELPEEQRGAGAEPPPPEEVREALRTCAAELGDDPAERP